MGLVMVNVTLSCIFDRVLLSFPLEGIINSMAVFGHYRHYWVILLMLGS